LEQIPAAIIHQKLKICQPVRDQGGHVGFWNCLKSSNTWSGPHKEHLWQVWSRSL